MDPIDVPGPKKLKHWRESLSLSQEAAGERLDASQATVCDWESGRKLPKLDSALKIRRVTGIPVEDWSTEDATLPASTSEPPPPEHETDPQPAPIFDSSPTSAG